MPYIVTVYSVKPYPAFLNNYVVITSVYKIWLILLQFMQ